MARRSGNSSARKQSPPRGVTKLRKADDYAIVPIPRLRTTSDDLAARQLAQQSKKRILAPKQGRRGSFDPQGDAGRKFR